MRYAPALACALLLAGCASDDPRASDATRSAGALGWKSHAPAPTPRTEVAAAELARRIYVIGGFDPASQATDKVEVYDVANDTWTSAKAYPIPIHHTAAVTLEGQVYVLGGYTPSSFTPTEKVHRYDPARDVWEALPNLPRARGAHAAAVLDGRIYVVGGVGRTEPGSVPLIEPGGGSVFLAKVDVLDPASGTWSQAPDLPMPREHLTAAVQNGTLHALAGRNPYDSDAHHTLRSGATAWTEAPGVPTKRAGLAAASFRNRVAVIGGEGPRGTYSEVETFDPSSSTWSSWPGLPTARHGLGAAVAGDRLYVLLGGPQPGFTMSAVVESLGPS